MISKSELINFKLGEKLVLTKVPKLDLGTTCIFRLGDIVYFDFREEVYPFDNDPYCIRLSYGKDMYWVPESTFLECFSTIRSVRENKIEMIENGL
jgi:hypothetical protein